MNDPSALDSVLLDLLVEWEERKAAGTPVTPEELCRDCPERIEYFRKQVEGIARLDPLLALASIGENERSTIPGFVLLDEVGRGGMGVVYRARDLSLDRVVAVKVPFGGPGASLSRTRFEREARTLAKLRHQNIVPVHAAGLAGGTPYFVMDYVGGGSLAARMGEWAGAPKRVAALMMQVALSVDHAHAAGIAHRDLKPSNILLDEAGRPFVSDFGVAALMAGESLTDAAGDTPDDRGHGQTRVTRTGAAVGTAAYAAPELLPGRSGRPSAASDVWSLGVVLYECLTGRLPYPDPEAAGTAGAQPLPPRSIQPKIPRRLEAIVMRCLTAAPAGRYPTAAALARDLGRYADDRARRAGPAWLSAAIGVVVVVGAWGEFRQREEAQHQPVTVADPSRHDPAAEQTRVNERLVAGGEYAYDGTESHTGPFRSLVGGRGEPQRHPNGDGLSLSATGIELVELRPDLSCDQYEFTAQVRVDHAGSVGESRAGLYFCFRAAPAVQAAEPWTALTASFAELGREAGDRPPPNQRSEGRVLGWISKDREARTPLTVPLGVGPRYKPSFAAGAAGPWRELGVRVSSADVTMMWREDGRWDETVPLPAASCSSKLASAAKYLPPWAAPLPGFHKQGGLGLYAHNCRVTFRWVVVRAIPGV